MGVVTLFFIGDPGLSSTIKEDSSKLVDLDCSSRLGILATNLPASRQHIMIYSVLMIFSKETLIRSFARLAIA